MVLELEHEAAAELNSCAGAGWHRVFQPFSKVAAKMWEARSEERRTEECLPGCH